MPTGGGTIGRLWGSAQLSAGNAARAVIAVYRIPSWSHDPSPELRELVPRLPEDLRGSAEDLAEIARTLAPEHGRAAYGEPLRGLTPWEVYSSEDAERALEAARRACQLMSKILEKLSP